MRRVRKVRLRFTLSLISCQEEILRFNRKRGFTSGRWPSLRESRRVISDVIRVASARPPGPLRVFPVALENTQT
jgi:hypothetical protein